VTAVTSYDSNAREVGQRLLLREVNERIREISISFGLASGSFELICECARGECFQRIDVPAWMYEQARREPGRCVVAASHTWELDQVQPGDDQRRRGVLVEPGDGVALAPIGPRERCL
jgi:hypothetical protein